MRRNAKDLGNDVAVEVDLPSPGGDERVEDGAGAEGGGKLSLAHNRPGLRKPGPDPTSQPDSALLPMIP